MQKGTKGEARLHVNAPPETVYDLVSDVSRMGEWSPECVACEWLEGATRPAVGARFRGANKHGMSRWSTKPTVVAAEAGREFAFVVRHLGRDMTKWTYRFEPAPVGTDLTESFEMLSSLPFYFRVTNRVLMRVKDRKADLEENMRRTLELIKTAAEAETASGA